MSSCNVNLHDAASQALLLQQEPLEHQLGELAPAKLKAYDRKAMSDWQLATEALDNADQKVHFDDQILDACHLKVRETVHACRLLFSCMGFSFLLVLTRM